jgi:hypothetical protein
MRTFMGYHPSKTELSAAPRVLVDLGNFADYNSVLGSSAPPASSVSNAVSVAIQWRMQRGPTEAWDAYVKAQDGIAWKEALTLLDEVKALFLIAAAKNPTLTTTYPGLARMFDAPKVAAKQATSTRKKNAKTAAAATAAATTAAAAPALAPAAVPKVTIST